MFYINFSDKHHYKVVTKEKYINHYQTIIMMHDFESLRNGLSGESLRQSLDEIARREASELSESAAALDRDKIERMRQVEASFAARKLSEAEDIHKRYGTLREQRISQDSPAMLENVVSILDPLAPWNQSLWKKIEGYPHVERYERDVLKILASGTDCFTIKLHWWKDHHRAVRELEKIGCRQLTLINPRALCDTLTELHLFSRPTSSIPLVISRYSTDISVIFPIVSEPGKPYAQLVSALIGVVRKSFSELQPACAHPNENLNYINVTYATRCNEGRRFEGSIPQLIQAITKNMSESPPMKFAGIVLEPKNVFVVDGIQEGAGSLQAGSSFGGTMSYTDTYPEGFIDAIKGEYLVPDEARRLLLERHGDADDRTFIARLTAVVQSIASIPLEFRDGKVQLAAGESEIYYCCRESSVYGFSDSRIFTLEDGQHIITREPCCILNDYLADPNITPQTKSGLGGRFFDPVDPANLCRKPRPEAILPYDECGTYPKVIASDGKPSYLIKQKDCGRL